MLVPLPEVLALPSFLAADVIAMSGDPEAALVRWVHSSEVYEMGSLLAGGEVLLTTGLGLHTRSPAQLEAYVDQVADAGCVALGLEVGRSFFTVPEPILAAARRRGLVVLSLGSVVPFERMIEDFHELVLARRLADGVTHVPRGFLEVVVTGAGLRALLDEVARAAGCRAEYLDVEGRLVERSRIATGRPGAESTGAAVRGAHGALGQVVLRAAPDQRRDTLAAHAAIAVALELGRHPDLGRRPSLAQSVITDLHAAELVSRGDVLRRVTEAGLPVGDGRPVVVVAVDAGARTPAVDLVALVEEHWPGLVGTLLAGVVGTHLLVILPAQRSATPDRLRSLLTDAVAVLEAQLSESTTVLAGVVGPSADLTALPELLADARAVVRAARRHGRRPGVVMARDVGIQQLLASGIDAARLSAFVDEQIGPLIDHDRQYAGELVRTLDAYLGSGLSKTVTAAALGIRRQSLYARLDRIQRMLGVDLGDPSHRSGLDLALTAWRMRTGLDPQAAFERGRPTSVSPVGRGNQHIAGETSPSQ